jgi:hypothetical protein
MLIKLSNGYYINPAYIVSVRTEESRPPGPLLYYLRNISSKSVESEVFLEQNDWDKLSPHLSIVDPDEPTAARVRVESVSRR